MAPLQCFLYIQPFKMYWPSLLLFKTIYLAFFTNKIILYLPSAVCDYMGEKMASLFGITTPKYQYAIDEYYRIKKEVRFTTDNKKKSIVGIVGRVGVFPTK